LASAGGTPPKTLDIADEQRSFLDLNDDDQRSFWTRKVKSVVGTKREGKAKDKGKGADKDGVSGKAGKADDKVSFIHMGDEHKSLSAGLGFTLREKKDARKRASKLNNVSVWSLDAALERARQGPC
jgi:hypothetical protein